MTDVFEDMDIETMPSKYFYCYVKGYAIAIEYRYTTIALSIAYKYYEVRGKNRFNKVLFEVCDYISDDKPNDYICACTILQDVISEYKLTDDVEEFAKKYQFTNENIETLNILASEEKYKEAIKTNPLKSIAEDKKFPEYVPYNELEKIYDFIEDYAKLNGYKNTLIALKTAKQIHSGQKRKGGQPYIIHPLFITLRIIYSNTDDDITCAAALLHDSIEENDELNETNGSLLVTKYGLDEEVLRLVRLLTKPRNYKEVDPKEAKYYAGIKTDIRAANIKLHDRTDNLSTIEVFNLKKMIEYVDETKERVYPLLKLKNHYPEYSQAFTNIKYVLRSNCEVIEAILRRKPSDADLDGYKKTLYFLKGFAKGKNMTNTQKALVIACKLHEGQYRTLGDPFVIHPLRVALYLVNLRITDDAACAAALLHEVFKKCNVTDGGKEITEKYELSPEVFELVKLVSRPEDMSKEEYYNNLKKNYKALLIKLSNRANTCTILNTYENNEIDDYIAECNNYIYPLCEYGAKHYPKYSHQINVMRYHIYQISNIVGFLKHLDI